MSTGTAADRVDIIVAVHDTRRNIRRAVASIISDDDPTIRAYVIAHNLPREEVERELAPLMAARPGRIRIEELHDGIPSPSGPFNHGLATSDAALVGIMGSDDELHRGAVAEWRDTLRRLRADAVIARVVRGEQGNLVRSPPKRVWKRGVLDFAKDRLSYRSAPLGLIRRDAISRLGLELLPGARNGGDLPFVTRLWFLGRVVPSRGLAAYVEHADAPVRVTHVAKPVREELHPIVLLLDDPLVRRMNRAAREALTTKLVRRNLTDSLRKRGGGRALTDDDIEVIREILATIETIAPRTMDLLSVAQRRTFDELRSPRPDLEAVARHDAHALRFRSIDAIRPARLRHLFHPQAQPRFMAASALIKIGASRYFPAAWATAVTIGVLAIVAAVAAIVAAVLR